MQKFSVDLKKLKWLHSRSSVIVLFDRSQTSCQCTVVVAVLYIFETLLYLWVWCYRESEKYSPLFWAGSCHLRWDTGAGCSAGRRRCSSTTGTQARTRSVQRTDPTTPRCPESSTTWTCFLAWLDNCNTVTITVRLRFLSLLSAPFFTKLCKKFIS